MLGDAEGTPVAVNRGGMLEKWARSRWPEAQLIAVEDKVPRSRARVKRWRFRP